MNPTELEKNRCIVRISTSAWNDKRGAYLKRSITYLKSKGRNIELLDEDCNMVGTLDTLQKITNLNAVSDGIYQLVMCNVQTDWETGYADDWDFKLIPFK